MEHVDTLLHARWIIPVEPDNTVYEYHTLVIKDDRIHALLSTQEAHSRYRAEITLELPEHALIPGLVNAHTHAAMTLFRGLADDLPLMEWLNNHIWPAEGTWVNPEFARDGTQLAMAEMLKGGVTCFNDMYFFPDETAQAAADAGMRAMVGMILIDFPTAWANDAEEYLRKGLELHDRFRNHPLIATAFAPHAPYTVSNGPLERVRVLAEELGVPIHMHVHETAAEIQQGLEQHGNRPLQRLDRLGLVSPHLAGVHLTQVNDAEIAAYARSGAHVVHCPESNLKLASGFCPVQKLVQAGINVAIGTDGAASNNDLDMFAEMRTAALLAKAVAQDASALPAAQALRMATLNGARALGLEEETGSLLPGKAADITAVNLGAIQTQPLYHPISQLVYAAGRHQVSDVWVAGQHLVKEAALTTLDEQDILAKAQTWQRKIRKFD
jgi:5-methylthioadenosine/S-adenosylhomocysteine deaminase